MPPTSFRLRLATDALVLGSWLVRSTPIRDFHPKAQAHAGHTYAGITCDAQATCPVAQGIRIPLNTDRRVFTPVDRSSYTWSREYAYRTAVERVNSRLDVSFGFEWHTIRGMAKMRARCGLALGRIRQQHPELLRSLVRSA